MPTKKKPPLFDKKLQKITGGRLSNHGQRGEKEKHPVEKKLVGGVSAAENSRGKNLTTMRSNPEMNIGNKRRPKKKARGGEKKTTF